MVRTCVIIGGIFLFGLLFVEKTLAQSNIEFFFNNPSQYQDVTVQEVVSADIIIIENYLKKGERVKLIGLKAPDVPAKKKKSERDEFGFKIKEEVSPLDPVEEKALNFTKELLEGKHIRLEFDSDRINEQHQTLAYAFLLEDNLFVNAEILRHGFANLQIRPPNTKYAKELRAAYKEAREEKRGLQGQ